MTFRSPATRKKVSSISGEKWIPKDYQAKAVRWLIGHKHAHVHYHSGAELLDPGLGKTTLTLKAFKVVRKAGGCNNALVVAPLRVAYNVWSHEEGGELHRWRRDFGDLRVSLLHGPKKEQRLEDDADLYVINVEGILWLTQDKRRMKRFLREKKIDVLIIDELSKFKNATSKRSRALRPYLGRFVRRWGLTGSPAPNGLIDLFGQILIIDRGVSLGRSITQYRNKYFNRVGFGGFTWALQDGAETKIHKLLKPSAISMRAEDHLDLPDLVTQNLWVNIPNKVMKHYRELEKELITVLEDGEMITAPNAAAASGRCRQIASGGIYGMTDVDTTDIKALSVENFITSGARKVIHLHDEKTNALIELINELQGSPLLVGYWFRHDWVRIQDALKKLPSMSAFKKKMPAINGDATPKEVQRYIKDWNAGEIPVLCCHPASAGHGLNLQQSGHHVCWYSLPWDFELYDQFNRRVWRQGCEAERVVIHHIVARGTVDQHVIKSLVGKKRIQDGLLDALKARVKKKH